MFKVTRGYLQQRITLEGKIPSCCCCGKELEEGEIIISKTSCKGKGNTRCHQTMGKIGSIEKHKSSQKRYCKACAKLKNIWQPRQKKYINLNPVEVKIEELIPKYKTPASSLRYALSCLEKSNVYDAKHAIRCTLNLLGFKESDIYPVR
jgi:hypothetical protein